MELPHIGIKRKTDLSHIGIRRKDNKIILLHDNTLGGLGKCANHPMRTRTGMSDRRNVTHFALCTLESPLERRLSIFAKTDQK